MDHQFLTSMLAIFSLLSISSLVYMIAKKTKLPYTILLVIAGFLLIPLSKIGFLHFLVEFKLTPEMLFFVFLPILIFESGYNMGYRQLIKNWKSIGSLAIFGLLISTFLIGYTLNLVFRLIGLDIPLEVTMLFGAIISSTDPVAVLSLFKQFGAPRRLVLIFEGESLFNDGTALALFLVMLAVIKSGVITTGTLGVGFATFLCMLFGGIIFGGAMGFGFSKLIEKVKGNENLEIAFTMIVAHMTFILSEIISEFVKVGNFEIKISGVIATALASIVVGNYGRYKISHKVEEYMESFWGFVAFVANSLVFMLMGTMFLSLNVNLADFILPIIITILIVIIARGISIYLPINILNYTKLEEKIPPSWQHLLAWGSLRGALALMMVLMIPDDFKVNAWTLGYSVKEFLLALTIGSIMFTLFVKAPTIGFFVNKLKINKLNDVEHFQKHESMILIYTEILKKIESILSKGHISKSEYETLNKKYKKKLDHEIEEFKKLLSKVGESENLIIKALSLHALGIEKQYLKELFRYNEIDEYIFKYMLGKINRQIERIEGNKTQVKKETLTEDIDLIDKILNYFHTKDDNITYQYLKNRTKYIVSSKVIVEFEILKNIEWGFSVEVFDEVIELYSKFNVLSKQKMDEIYSKHEKMINLLDVRLVNKSLLKLEEKTVKSLYEKEFVTPKLYVDIMDSIEHKIARDAKVFV
ncbi:MAG: cation:proton antiporter [Candidatus Gracilibacteria bacterium]|nr:cation:proton antiporter [Candidatus Gracilibacteria bacterium]